MPNHETNNVVILGEPANIRRFVDEALIDYPLDEGEALGDKPAKVLDFAHVIPEPENLEHGGCNGEHAPGIICWLPWRRENWGTKWSAYGHSHYALYWLQGYGDDAKPFGRVDLRFETAWSQPTPIFEAIQERWGVKVHAVTQDEGGYPDVIFGEPLGEALMYKVETFEFDVSGKRIDEPAEVTA